MLNLQLPLRKPKRVAASQGSLIWACEPLFQEDLSELDSQRAKIWIREQFSNSFVLKLTVLYQKDLLLNEQNTLSQLGALERLVTDGCAATNYVKTPRAEPIPEILASQS